MWIVTEEFYAKADCVPDVEAKLGTLVAAMRRESGCEGARFGRSAHVDSIFVLVARFVDEAAYIDHTRAAHWQESLDALIDHLEQPPRVGVFEECA